MTSLRPDERDLSAFLRRNPSRKGPFQTERAIAPGLLLVPATDDHPVRNLVVARLVALGALAPGGDRVTATRGAAFATAVRVIDRVHHDAADMRADALPAVAAGLAHRLVRLVGVRHRADRRHAFAAHDAQLAGRQLQLGIAGIAADQLDIGAGRAGELTAVAGLHLDIMHDRADR